MDINEKIKSKWRSVHELNMHISYFEYGTSLTYEQLFLYIDYVKNHRHKTLRNTIEINKSMFGKRYNKINLFVNFHNECSANYFINIPNTDEYIYDCIFLVNCINDRIGFDDYNNDIELLKKDIPERKKEFEKIVTIRPEKKSKFKERKYKTYIMKDESTGFYKIGRSVNPKYREKTLQSEKPTIRMIYFGKIDIEKSLHKRFKDKRIRGEWFDLQETDINYIKSLT